MITKGTRTAQELTRDVTDENDILASFERGEWLPVKGQKKENLRYQTMAGATLAKNRRVNIRITAMDLEGLQAKAAEEGLPYQTLMASVLHKYVSGRLVDVVKTAAPRRSPKKTTSAA